MLLLNQVQVVYDPFILLFFNDTATTEIYTLSLHDALPISRRRVEHVELVGGDVEQALRRELGREQPALYLERRRKARRAAGRVEHVHEIGGVLVGQIGRAHV